MFCRRTVLKKELSSRRDQRYLSVADANELGDHSLLYEPAARSEAIDACRGSDAWKVMPLSRFDAGCWHIQSVARFGLVFNNILDSFRSVFKDTPAAYTKHLSHIREHGRLTPQLTQSQLGSEHFRISWRDLASEIS